jgi:hypothetical protein
MQRAAPALTRPSLQTYPPPAVAAAVWSLCDYARSIQGACVDTRASIQDDLAPKHAVLVLGSHDNRHRFGAWLFASAVALRAGRQEHCSNTDRELANAAGMPVRRPHTGALSLSSLPPQGIPGAPQSARWARRDRLKPQRHVQISVPSALRRGVILRFVLLLPSFLPSPFLLAALKSSRQHVSFTPRPSACEGRGPRRSQPRR